MGTRPSVILLLISFLFVQHSLIHAQDAIPVEKLTKTSDLILTAEITSITSEWNKDHSAILSSIIIQPEQFFKGEIAEGELTIIQPGGEVGGIGEAYSDIPKFTKNEKVLIFLKNNNNGFRITNGLEGKYSIQINPHTNEPIISGMIRIKDIAEQVKEIESSSNIK